MRVGKLIDDSGNVGYPPPLAAPVSSRVEPMPWEYVVEDVFEETPWSLTAHLNARGKQGWELVTATRLGFDDEPTTWKLFLKRIDEGKELEPMPGDDVDDDEGVSFEELSEDERPVDGDE